MKFITNLKNNLARTALTLLLAVLTTSAWAIQQDPDDGYYLIGSVQDWHDFAALVNGGTTNANARMTADIDLGNDQTRIGSTSDSNSALHYQGVFDGQGHMLTIAYVETGGSNLCAPFNKLDGATVKNLHIKGSITTAGIHGAGVASDTRGTTIIENVWVEVNVTSSHSGWDECSGIVGCMKAGSLTISDCLFSGSVTASSIYNGGFIGYKDSGSATITNCLSTGTFNYTNSQDFLRGASATNCYYTQFVGAVGNMVLASAEQLSNGTTASALQNSRPETIWVQDLETNQPILKIFAIPGLQQDNEGYYLLGSMQNWKDFATLVETTPTANARMTADIDLGDDQTMIGTEAIKYQGTFDGRGHTLTIAYNVSVDRAAPFFYINNATIRNLHTAGSLTTTGQCGSGVVGAAHGTCSIECCHSSVAINATSSSRGDSYGGFVGLRASGGNLTISDCLFDGSITTTKKQHNGGFVGYSESGTTTAENCLLTATFDCGTDYSCTFLRYTGTITNSYYLNSLGTLQGTQTNTEELANGRVAYLLQTGRTDMFWGQEIGVDDQPVPTNDESKRVYLQRDGTYANTPDDGTLTQDADGYYLIGTVVDWQDFAAVVNGGTINTNARMTADIVLGVDQTMVGTASSPFHGTFDGQGHTLTVAYHQSTPAIAPFHFVGGGATIQNLHVDGCITNADNAAGGIAGQILGNLTIRNCWSSVVLQTRNTGNVQGTIGGICSFCEAESCAILIEDCIFTGTIVNTENAGGFMSHVRQASSSVTMRRCLNAGTYSADERQTGTFIRVLPNVTFGALNLETATLFYKNRLGVVQGTQATDETLADGTITTALQNGREEEIWVQDPVTNQPMLKLFATPSFTFDVTGYGTSTESDRWVFIASPVTGSIEPTAVENLVAETATEYDLYRFNQSASKEWENYKNPTHTTGFVLENGKGYLYANKNNVTLTFIGTYNTGSSMDVDLDYDGSARLAGYNLVGNPFLTAAVINKNYYTMNAQGTGIVAEEVNSSEPIPPFTGVIVQATDENQSVTFTKATRQSTAPNQGNLQITVAQANTRSNTIEDNAIVSFNEGSLLGKFYFGTQRANLYIPQGTEEYAIAYSDGQGEMPVNFRTNENGQYTITVNPEGVEMAYLHLIDNMTGADVDLLQTPEYTFNAKVTDYESRFKLVFASVCKDADGDNETFAFISNGQIIVNGTGTLQIIDVMGRIVYSGDTKHCVSTTGMAPGVYVLRLINGDNVKVQKMIVR